MPCNKPDHPAEPDFLARIGLDDARALDPDDPDLWEDLRGDLSGVLRARFADLIRRHAFAPGALVTWKPGLKNKRLPAYGAPAVVVEVLATPVHDGECDGGSTYFREPLDLVLGIVPDTGPARGELLTFHFDARRFQPWDPEA